MSRITQQLLRKRAQHNEGMLTTLEEISLHQQEIIKIENLDVFCRHLKILYLQNNIIDKLQNLNKLKELQYLNIALNNISVIENIEDCESLKKLDFTVNFIDVDDLKESVACLSKLPSLKEIYLTGNPCEDWPGCQDYIIAHVPLLQTYNGTVILPSHRIKAIQSLPILENDLKQFAKNRKKEKKKKQKDEQQQKKRREQNGQKPDQATQYTKQSRKQMYLDLAKDKQKKQRQRNPEKFQVKKQSSMMNEKGQIRQCNQGKYQFSLQEYDDNEYSFFQLQVPKHMQTSQLIVNLDPKWVSVRIRGKLTQMRLTQEIVVSESTVERAQITGILVIKMKKSSPHDFIKSKAQIKKLEEEAKQKQKDQKKQKQQSESKTRLKLCQQFQNREQKKKDDVPDLE